MHRDLFLAQTYGLHKIIQKRERDTMHPYQIETYPINWSGVFNHTLNLTGPSFSHLKT